MTLSVQIDEGACLAHGDCEHVAPRAFAVNGDVAEIVGPRPTTSCAPPPARVPQARSCCSTRLPAKRLIRDLAIGNISVSPTKI